MHYTAVQKENVKDMNVTTTRVLLVSSMMGKVLS